MTTWKSSLPFQSHYVGLERRGWQNIDSLLIKLVLHLPPYISSSPPASAAVSFALSCPPLRSEDSWSYLQGAESTLALLSWWAAYCPDASSHSVSLQITPSHTVWGLTLKLLTFQNGGIGRVHISYLRTQNQFYLGFVKMERWREDHHELRCLHPLVTACLSIFTRHVQLQFLPRSSTFLGNIQTFIEMWHNVYLKMHLIGNCLMSQNSSLM